MKRRKGGLKPLTRQQVRAILDRNAVAINAHADQGLDLNKFGAKVSDLGDQIRRGENPAATDAGLELLKGLQTRRAPAGYIKYMIDAARRAPVDALAKLRRRSTPAEINRAILQLNANAVSILSGRDSGGLAEDGDTTTPR